MDAARRALAIATVTLTAAQTLGCWAIHNVDRDVDRSPVVNTGAGATIIYPGQNAPQHPGNYHPREAGYGQGALAAPGVTQSASGPAGSRYAASGPPAPAPSYPLPPNAVAAGVAVPPPEYASGSASQRGSAAPRGAGMAMLGGTEIEETKHIKVDEEPKFLKYLGLPFAVIAAPFKYGADKIAGDPKPGPAVPRNDTQPRPMVQPANATADYETARLRDMQRELDQRAVPGTAVASAPAPGAPSGSSFADELAALRRRANPAPAPAQAPAPSAAPAPPVAAARPVAPTAASGAAIGQVDRNGDGRTDHWITRENGAIAREEFDENFDGRPDRALVYDPASHEVVQIEEDTNFDGRTDAWTALRGGQVVGRRVDDNGDGQVDSWSTYRAGAITRLERDTNGDGFRDRVAYYQDGRLAREERDDDGDGRTDLISYFDANEHVSRVEEDANDDGEMDVVSYYEDGRLARREVLDTSVLGAAPRSGPERE
jgi:antitoxin component YwqK of YwqJK toxin-antitoxin module